MGVDMKWIRSGTQIAATVKGGVPIKGELILDAEDSKLMVKYDQPSHQVHLLTVKVEPSNFLLLVPRSLQQLPFTYELAAINNRDNVRTFVWQVCRPPSLVDTWA